METLNSIAIPNELLFEHALEYLSLGKSIIIAVKGKSMNPFLKEGDKILLNPVVGKDLSKGMIVLAKSEGKMLLHRLIKLEDVSACMAGDNNLVLRECVDRADIVAVAECIYRGDREVHLNRKWKRFLGMVWYQARPLRRVIGKVLKRGTYN